MIFQSQFEFNFSQCLINVNHFPINITRKPSENTKNCKRDFTFNVKHRIRNHIIRHFDIDRTFPAQSYIPEFFDNFEVKVWFWICFEASGEKSTRIGFNQTHINVMGSIWNVKYRNWMFNLETNIDLRFSVNSKIYYRQLMLKL